MKTKKLQGFDLRDFGDYYIPSPKNYTCFGLKNIYDNYQQKINFNDYLTNLPAIQINYVNKIIAEYEQEEQIRRTWEEGLKSYKVIRKNIYSIPIFE